MRTLTAFVTVAVFAAAGVAADKPLAWLVEAEALGHAGAFEEARTAADRALALALSEEQRERMRDRLAELWEQR